MEKTLRTNYVLIDYENVQAKSLHLLEEEHFHILVFLGPNNTKLPVDFVLAMHKLGVRSSYIALEKSGNNALDFHLAYYLGNLAISEPTAYFHIISKDTGFDPLIQHLKGRKIACTRSTSIEEMPCFNVTQATQKLDEKPAVVNQTLPIKEPSLDELLKIFIEDLINRKTSKPKTTKTLKSTIQTKLGKTGSAEKAEQILNLLSKKGYVKVDGTKISYALPTGNQAQ